MPEQNNVTDVTIKKLSIRSANGNYNLIVRENRSLILAFSFIGYQIEKIRIPMLKSGQHYKLDIKLKTSSNVLNDVIITDQRSRKESFNKIKKLNFILIFYLNLLFVYCIFYNLLKFYF